MLSNTTLQLEKPEAENIDRVLQQLWENIAKGKI